MSEIHFQSDGYRISGNLFVPENTASKGAFLFIQGWTGNQNTRAAQAVTELGYTTMTYDMRGNKTSEGNIEDFSRADFIKDAEVAYDYLRQQVGEKALIGVVGSSFGGYTAAILSSTRPVHCLSLRVPANYPDERHRDPHAAQMGPALHEWRAKVLGADASMALRAIHQFTGKVQIIEAGADAIVASQTPQNYAHAIADKSLLKYEIMPDAPHGLDTDDLARDYTDRLTTWIKNL